MTVSSFADAYYKSIEWKNTRSAYLSKVAWLCEQCQERGLITPAVEVHHIRPLTAKSIRDPAERTSFDNLKALCVKCHDEIHAEMKKKKLTEAKRYTVNADGSILERPDPPPSQKKVE